MLASPFVPATLMPPPPGQEGGASGFSPEELLQAALHAGDLNGTLAALALGANPNVLVEVVGHRSQEPVLVQRWLHDAAFMPHEQERTLVAAVLAAGAWPDARAAEGHRTLLDDASRARAWGAVEALLNAGATIPVTAQAPGGWLDVLATRQAPIALLLRALDGNETLPPDPGSLPRLLADHLRAVLRPDSPPCLPWIQALLDRGALNIAAPPPRPWLAHLGAPERASPLALAAQRGEIEAMNLLLAAGASPHERFTRTVSGLTARHQTMSWSNPDWTALHLAAEANQARACERLLAVGADSTARTALPWSMQAAVQRMATLILPIVPRDAPGVPGYTPLELAMACGAHQAVAALERQVLRRCANEAQGGPATDDRSSVKSGRSRSRL